MSRHVCLVAAEASGDALGADVLAALRVADPQVRLSGIGGEKMKAAGISSGIDMSGLAVLGLVDGLKAFGRVKAKVREAAAEIMRADPDAVVLIDSWGFMWRLARELKLRGARAKRIKLVGPQVWATRPGRARVLAQWCDHLLCILPVEPPFYERWGLPTTVIGNPALGRVQRGDGVLFRAADAVPPGTQVIGLLPGSRPSEMRRVAPTLIQACAELCHGRHDRKVVCIAAPSVATDLRAMAVGWAFPHIIVTDEARKLDALAAMDLALACSGTVTTELAVQGIPMVVGYRLGWITWAIARAFLWKSRFMVLLNVAAGEEIAPEFLQTKFTVGNVVRAAGRLLDDQKALESQRLRQAAALKEMAGPGRPAAEIAAETILLLAAQ